MSKVLKFPSKYSSQNNLIKDNFIDKLEIFHINCLEYLQKSEEYINKTDNKLLLRKLLISKYKVDEQIVDELIEITSDITALEFEYTNYHLPELFLDKNNLNI